MIERHDTNNWSNHVTGQEITPKQGIDVKVGVILVVLKILNWQNDWEQSVN
jgi:hypothetical protein